MIQVPRSDRFRSFLRTHAADLKGWGAALAVFVVFVAPLRTQRPYDLFIPWIVGQTIDKVYIDNAYRPEQNQAMCEVARAGAGEARSPLERDWRTQFQTLGIAGTPTLYAVYKIFSTRDFRRDYERYRVICAVVFALGLLLFARQLAFPAWSFAPLLFLFTVPFWPYRRDVIDANNSALLSGACLLIFLWLGRPSVFAYAIAGAAFGFLAAFKPTVSLAPTLIVLVLMVRRKELFLTFTATFTIGLVLSMVAGQAVMGPALSWRNWIGWSHVRALEPRVVAGGIPGRFLSVGRGGSIKMFAAAFFLGLAGLTIWLSKRRAFPSEVARPNSTSQPDLYAAKAGALGLLLYLLIGPYVWAHYFLLAVPATLIALRRLRRSPLGLACVILCAFLVGSHPLFLQLRWTRADNYSALTFLGVFGLLLIVGWDWWRERAPTEAPASASRV